MGKVWCFYEPAMRYETVKFCILVLMAFGASENLVYEPKTAGNGYLSTNSFSCASLCKTASPHEPCLRLSRCTIYFPTPRVVRTSKIGLA